MRAIYYGKPVLCVVMEDDWDTVTLEPVDGTSDQAFCVDYGDPNLILDPTDAQVAELEPVCRFPCRSKRK